MDDKYDSMLMGILQNEGKLDNFLDTVFSFLCRRTDFYHILTQEKQSMGFLPGTAEKMVRNSFKKFESLHREKYASAGGVAKPEPSKPAKPSNAVEMEPSKPVKPQETRRTPESSVEKTDGDRTYQAPPESYNGADRGTFSWSQTIADLDLRVQVPSHIKKAKDVKVKLTKKTISIDIRSDDNEFISFMDEAFPWDINCEESMWSLIPADGHIHINVEKAKERWWDKALTVENDAIDVRQIDCSRPMSELDEESQAKIQQLMYDQQQKEKGLPTSEQQNMTNLLAKAWNAEGSPFQGQQFDPSRVKIGADGSASIQ